MVSYHLKLFIAWTIFLAASLVARAQHTPPATPGQTLYITHCAKCHGKTGTKKGFGVKKIQTSILDDAALFELIAKGKKSMPAWEKLLTREEIEAVIGYVKALKKP